jgi:hypothetical protein
MEILNTDINNLYKNLFDKYQLDKIISKQKNEFSEIDQLISNINSQGNIITASKYNRNRINTYGQKIFLSKRLFKYLSEQEIFKRYIIRLEMTNRDFANIFNHFWSYNKLTNTDNEIYTSILQFQNFGRYERKKYVQLFIDKWTSKIKDITIDI